MLLFYVVLSVTVFFIILFVHFDSDFVIFLPGVVFIAEEFGKFVCISKRLVLESRCINQDTTRRTISEIMGVTYLKMYHTQTHKKKLFSTLTV